MRSSILVALLAMTTAMLTVSIEARARVDTRCTAFGRTCGCPLYVRDCLPTCHLQPRIKCDPASQGVLDTTILKTGGLL
jgi:hypothetical protein